MERVHRVSTWLLPISAAGTLLLCHHSSSSAFSLSLPTHRRPKNRGFPLIVKHTLLRDAIPGHECHYGASTAPAAGAGWFSSFGGMRKKQLLVPDIVKAGDPVLHEPASEVAVEDIGSDRIQKIIDDMIAAMRNAPGVGLAAPQIGIPLRIIVLEDTKEYINYAPKKEIEAQDRRPFDLLVILNPKLKKKGNKTTFFFEGCLSVDGFRAVVERHREVEVTGLGRDGLPMELHASGWQARILQHECDHLDGTIYVDKLVPRTFRTVENLDLPLPVGCPKLGVH